MKTRIKSYAKEIFKLVGLDVQFTKSRDALGVQTSILSGFVVDTVVDAGAHLGEWTAKYRGAFPNAKIYGFEPFPETAIKYADRFNGESLVKPVRAALADSDGTSTLHVNALAATNSLLPADIHASKLLPDSNWVTNIGKIDVRVLTLDSFTREESIDRINILKMDIQGGELAAIRGATKLLADKRIDLIYTELMVGPHYKGQSKYFEVCSVLDQFDYTLYSLHNQCINCRGRLGWLDGIFVRRSLIGE